MNNSERLCLQWNDFKQNISSSFGELREDKDLTDVTLACEDGKQVEAHKVVLAASSPFFKDILKRNKHPHPLIYMRGLTSEDLLAITDFLYFGEANVLQENLDSFLALAEELRLKGLTGTGNTGEAKEPPREVELAFQDALLKKENVKHSKSFSNVEHQISSNPETAVAVNPINTDLDEKIKSMMTTTDVKTADGRRYVASCNICGKQTSTSHMPNHIEGNHITGVSHSCDICGKVSWSRKALTTHKQRYHKTLL